MMESMDDGFTETNGRSDRLTLKQCKSARCKTKLSQLSSNLPFANTHDQETDRSISKAIKFAFSRI